MASSFEHTVKIPSKFQNPYCSYDDMMNWVQLQVIPLILREADRPFFETFYSALQWEVKHLELKYNITALNICDVVEDIDFSNL